MATVPPQSQDATSGAKFRAIFDGEFQYIWRSLHRLGVAPRDLEDVTHDVLVQVFRNLHRYDSSRPIRPWLFAFALRFASDYRRLARHRVERFGDGAEPAVAPRGEDCVTASESRALVLAGLERLDLGRRAVFILHDLDERPMHEIADALNIPLQTAYSRLHSAREDFADAVRRLQPEVPHRRQSGRPATKTGPA
jgi:RNA polymerase sigma-70 factor, ECF subfamily